MRSLTSRLTLTLVCLGAAVTPATAQQADKSAENAKMAWEFHRAVANVPVNSLISPHSIGANLGMLSLGARGQTLEELSKALHHSQTPTAAGAAYCLESQRIEEMATKDRIDFASCSALLVGKATVVSQEYRMAIANTYHGEILNTLAELKEWMRRATKGNIDSTQDKEMGLDEFLAVNAVYFKGKFEKPFKKTRTENAPFYVANGMKAEVPMMRETSEYATAAGEGFRRLRLPYKGGRFALEILLPDEGRKLAQLERATTPDGFARLLALPLKTELTEVYLPRFKFRRDYNLIAGFRSLGLKSLVNPGVADLSGICGAPGTFRMAGAKHITQVEVDEVGTEAVAVTISGGSGGCVGGPAPAIPVFRADHPFLFVIRTDDTILFIGRVENPHPSAR